MLIRNAPDVVVRSSLHNRVRWMVGVVLLAFVIMVGRLWQLQALRGDEYFRETRQNVVDKIYLPSVRGKILDRRGRPFADNRPAFNIYARPDQMDASSLARLQQLLELSEEEVQRASDRLASGRERDPIAPALLLEDQGRARASLVRQEALRFPGLEVRDEPFRHYPNGAVGAHLVGYLNQLTAEEYVERRSDGYDASDKIGRYGLEREWENFLRGKKGIERYVKNARGERIEGEEVDELIEGPRRVPPIAGHNVVLTIDLELQDLVEKSLRKHAAGAVAVVEVSTGRILALASHPSFDSNVMSGHLTRAQESELLSDPRKPFLDKALRQHYPPGSIFKFVTAIAALEDGLIDVEEPLSCPGYHQQGRRRARCSGNHEKLNLTQALQHSCNVYFWKLAERVGLDRIAEVATDFGFGEPTGLGLNGDVPGRIPTRGWYEERGTFKIGYTLNAAVGQGDVEVTVLQMAMAYAAIANGGDLYVPQVVERVETGDGETTVAYEPLLRRRLSVPEESLASVRRGMWMVVNTVGGTAHDTGYSEIVEYAGKTGTAQVRSWKRGEQDTVHGWNPRRDHAWFAGYAPAHRPEISVVVLIEHGGAGGKEAVPVARAIVEGYYRDIRTAGLWQTPPESQLARGGL